MCTNLSAFSFLNQIRLFKEKWDFFFVIGDQNFGVDEWS